MRRASPSCRCCRCCAIQVIDLEALDAFVSTRHDDAATYAAYETWMRSRDAFRQQQSISGGDGWQKDYFQGRDSDGQHQQVREHHTKLRSVALRGGERLGLAGPPLPDEENLSATAAAGGGELFIAAQAGALRWSQQAESLMVHWPEDLALTWRGGCDFEVHGKAELRARVRIAAEAGCLLIDTGLRLRTAAAFSARLRSAMGPSTMLQLREEALGGGGNAGAAGVYSAVPAHRCARRVARRGPWARWSW